MKALSSVYRTPRDPGGFPFGYNWRATVTGLALLVGFNFGASQYVAGQFRYQPALGRPLFRTRTAAIYQPFAWCIWGYRNCTTQDTRIRKPLFEGEMIVLGGCVLSMVAFFVAANRRARRLSENAEDLHGSARLATQADIEDTGLIRAKGGVYVGGWYDQSARRLRYLRHNGPEHILAFAPTRSGKGVGLVIPTLLAVERVETASEALLVSLNETGQINWPRMEALTGKPASDLQDELGSLAYRNPEGGAWETADKYLSGNVRTKLVAAQASAHLDPAYRRNVEALQAVQPPDLEPGEIEARLGSSWVPRSDIRDFVAELLDVAPATVKVGYAESIATWTLELDYAAKYTVSNTTTHGTARFRASDLVEQSLNGRTPTAYDEDPEGNRTVNQPETIAAREKQQQLKDRFGEWVWEDPIRAKRLADDYNFRFNNIRLRDFDGSHLTLPGMVRTSLRDGDLAPHQKNAVWRILQGGSPLLAHVVGAGKTWTMTAAAMELRRLDLAKKPMFVVPNHLVDQWGAEFLKLYPQARLFIAGKEHFAAENRQQAMARIATGNYDAVIVSHRSFEFLPVSDEYFNRFVQKQVAELDAEIGQAKESKDDNRRIVKELEKAKRRLTVRLKKRADREAKDRTLTFEELGVDQLFVDEADLYKTVHLVDAVLRRLPRRRSPKWIKRGCG